MYATNRRQTDRQTDVRQHHRLMPLPRGWGQIIIYSETYNVGWQQKKWNKIKLQQNCKTVEPQLPNETLQ